MSGSFLDLRTLAFVLMLVTALLSVAMIFVWRKHKTYPGFGLWAFSNFTAAVGFLLVGFRGSLPDFITIIGANAFAFGSIVLSLEGIRRFRGVSSRKYFSLGSILLLILLFSYFTYVENNLLARIIIVSLMSGIACFLCAIELMRKDESGINNAYKQVGILFILAAVTSIARTFLTYRFSDIQDLFSPDTIQSFSFVGTILFTIALAFGYIILNSERTQNELQKTQSELEKLATTDFLTGINNTRKFFEISANEIQRCQRFRTSLSVIMFDIDFFKRINDTFGHAAGDKVLIEVVGICKKTLRGIDVLGRLGGEEFAVLLPHTDIKGALTVAEYLRAAIEKAEFKLFSETVNVTASFGVSGLLDKDKQIKTVLGRADSALYEAKRNGRNQVVLNLDGEPAEFAVALS
ncbi:MAG: hypothetical protein JWN60_55 [Acidobacteria bacterium]|jgi:diguanylate cyclase (GGDEF)-like protein|nr:hypothetical protein [Acidobacteriota bacterium]